MTRNRWFWAILLIFAGILILLDNLGIIRVNVWGIIWPLAIILIGVQMLWTFFRARNLPQSEQLNIPLQNETNAEIKVKHGAGRLSIGANPLPGSLLSGSFTGGIVHEVMSRGSGVSIDLRSPADVIMGAPWSVDPHGGFQWTLDLTQQIPLTLELNTGASESEIDLTNLQVTDLRLETGASSTRVMLPAHAGFTRVRTQSGAAAVDLRIPQGVAAQIHAHGGLASIDVDQQRFPGGNGVYASLDYSTAQNRVEIDAETGVGSITIR
ncbi:MAG TPA: DUF5668 domain-containing protein [Anaerolineaceae bacterium]|nr:DUF5668 domain-containing protein [Anaerolineaceae bacterium]